MTAILKCENIKKQYKDFSLKSISFSMEAGYLTGLIGINGAGKTTLIHILAGMDKDFQGDVVIDGINIRKEPTQGKRKVALISEKVSYFVDKTALENGQMLGVYFENWSMENYYLWLDRLRIPKGQPLYQFSKGMRMKFQLGFAMAHSIQFLLLDEPTAGFDPVFRKDFVKILQDIREEGVGILMSTHITSDLEDVADFIILLDHGEMKLNDTKEALQDQFGKKMIQGCLKRGFHIGDLLKQNGGGSHVIL